MINMESESTIMAQSCELYTPSSISQEILDQVDPDEFKRKMIAQVMQSTAGKQPLDYYLADLAVSCWMNHMEKTPEEFERMLASVPLPQVQQADEGGVYVEGDVLEHPVIMVERTRHPDTIVETDDESA
jgi:hypothetical protein